MGDSNNNDVMAEPGIRGMALMTRHSIASLRAPSISSNVTSSSNEDDIWKLNELRARFKIKSLDKLYIRYQQRLMHVDLKGYLLLQACLSFTLIVLFTALNSNDELRAVPEIMGQIILLLTAIIFYAIAYKKRRFKTYPHLHIFMALSLAFLLVAVDLGLDFWFTHVNKNYPNEKNVFHIPAALYTILVVYNLLPIMSVRVTIVIGFCVALIHLLASGFLFQTQNGLDQAMIIADATFYLAANIVGIFTKCLNETTLRRAFLDRRRCIETTIKLDYEKNQEEQLMLSILPKHIASEVGTDLREEVQMMRNDSKTPPPKKPFDNLHVEIHPEVSVLYADIVNFTPLTATLSSGDLVSMLNELFGRFDEAARENDCLRIKILGDCYYCVSGIPTLTTKHANNCVEMGFKMIEIIRQVREDHQVDVDMRIGVHSGSVISGLLGIRKWQFDIWSRDVTIANHMEQSGRAGRVHISKATKDLLGEAYKYEKGFGRKRDSYLDKLGIDTYLIIQEGTGVMKKISDGDGNKRIQFQVSTPVPRSNSLDISGPDAITSEPTNKDFDTSSIESLYEKLPAILPITKIQGRTRPANSLPHIFAKGRRVSLATGDDQSEEIYNRLRNARSSIVSGTGKRIQRRRSTAIGEPIRRGAVLLDSSVVSFRQMMDQADNKMETAIESMRLSKFKSLIGPNQEQPVNFSLLFTNRSWELPFMRRPDPLFGLYILGAIPVLVGIMVIQLVLYEDGARSFWLAFGIALIVWILVGLFLWVPRMWQHKRDSISNQDEDILGRNSISPPPSGTSSVSSTCFKLETMCSSLTARILIFLLVTAAVEACGLVDLEQVIHNYTNGVTNYTTPMVGQCQFKDPRVYLWYFTYICALTMTVAFSFYRIHFILKFTFYMVALVTYTVLTVNIYEDICKLFDSHEECDLCTSSLAMPPEVGHSVYLFTILLVLHVADRQIEFIYRLDYAWQRQLVSEQEEANTTRIVNKMLLLNILPLHVAEVYLDTSRSSDTLYHEEHKKVTVMFASIPNFMDYYAENDNEDGGIRCLEVLNSIISAFDALTYGDQFNRIEKIKLVGSTYMAASGLTSTNRRGSTGIIVENESSIASLVTMIRFASAMGMTLEKLNKKLSLDFKLRIGIDCGPVIAGVVGAQKPLYDIWGDTVNMASRLEYTSKLGEIQVTDKTAKLLEAENIQCEMRGETFLKGKGLVMTYWVRQDFSSIYERVNTIGISAGRNFLGFSDNIIPASARNSLTVQSIRPSIFLQENDEENHSRRYLPRKSIKSRRSSMVIPTISYDIFEENETSISTENIYLSVKGVDDADEVTHL